MIPKSLVRMKWLIGMMIFYVLSIHTKSPVGKTINDNDLPLESYLMRFNSGERKKLEIFFSLLVLKFLL
jgi:hypothetical protein